eukprot:g4108.t1
MFVSALSSARLQQKEKCRLQVIKTSVICIKVSGQTVFVDVTMLPFSQDMEIGLRNRIGPKRKAEVSYKTSVGHYFDSDGYLGQEEILAEFMKLVKKFEKEHSKEASGWQGFQIWACRRFTLG